MIKDLITNPASGRLSTSDTIVFGAFLVSSLVVLYLAWHDQLNEVIFATYITGFVAQNQFSKRASIQREALEINKGADDELA